MEQSDRFSSDQLVHIEALRAYAAQVRGDDDFRGDPRIVDQGRVMLSCATTLGLPLELCREVQAIVCNYDDEAGRPPEVRAAWFKAHQTIAVTEKRQAFLSIVQSMIKRHRSGTALSRTAAGKAIAASQRLPSDMTAMAAALEFCAFAIEGFGGEARAERPAWMAVESDPLS